MLSKALLTAMFAAIPLGGGLEISAATIPAVSAAIDSTLVIANIEADNATQCGDCEQSTCYEICWPFSCDCHWFSSFSGGDRTCAGDDGAGCHTGVIEQKCLEAHTVCPFDDATAALDLDALSAAVERGDVDRIRFLLAAYPDAVEWNESRSAVQVKACSGVPVAHFEMEMYAGNVFGGPDQVLQAAGLR